jgi:hypothetical protein
MVPKIRPIPIWFLLTETSNSNQPNQVTAKNCYLLLQTSGTENCFTSLQNIAHFNLFWARPQDLKEPCQPGSCGCWTMKVTLKTSDRRMNNVIMWDLNLCEQEQWLAGFRHQKSPFMEFICILDFLPYCNCSTSLDSKSWTCQQSTAVLGSARKFHIERLVSRFEIPWINMGLRF